MRNPAGGTLGNHVSRLQFLGSLGASAALLAACGGSAATLETLPSNEIRDLAYYMRKTGCAMVDYQGVQYFANGTTKQPGRQLDDCSVSSDVARKSDICFYATPTPAATVQYNVDFSFANIGPNTLQFGLTQSVSGYPAKIGPIYTSSTDAPDCGNPVQDAQEIAQKAAEYITENPGSFPTAVVLAAKSALDDWQGTGLGVAASADFAMEFFAFLGIALSPADFLIILAAIGVSIAVAIELWKCFHH